MLLRAAGGWTCILESRVIQPDEQDPPDGVEASGLTVPFDPEQRRSVPLPARSGTYFLTMVDDAWIATLQHEVDALTTATGPALASRCATLARLAPPASAAMQSQVHERVAHFLETGNADLPDAGSANAGPSADSLLESIAARCGFVDARAP
jgi:hypothetical protein